jgi:hypothetical protein
MRPAGALDQSRGMTTKTKPATPAKPAKPAARRRPAGAKAKAPAPRPKRPEDDLREALEELGKARDKASRDIRANIDTAIERVRETARDLRERAGQEFSDLDDTLSRATEDARRELGRRAVRAQQTPEALTELSTEIRKRRRQLAAN